MKEDIWETNTSTDKLVGVTNSGDTEIGYLWQEVKVNMSLGWNNFNIRLVKVFFEKY